jgi:uncharacterized protein
MSADELAAAIEARDEAAALALAGQRDADGDDHARTPARDSRGRSLLLLATFNRLPAVSAAIERQRGDDLDALEAAATGRADLLAAHLSQDRMATLAARTPEGFDAISLAAFLGGEDAVRTLLRHGADPEGDPANQLGIRPVHAAAAARDAAAMRALLEAGADPDSPQRGGITALHAAAQHDDVDTAKTLLDHGADPGRRADDGRDAAGFARAANAHRVLALIKA